MFSIRLLSAKCIVVFSLIYFNSAFAETDLDRLQSNIETLYLLSKTPINVLDYSMGQLEGQLRDNKTLFEDVRKSGENKFIRVYFSNAHDIPSIILRVQLIKINNPPVRQNSNDAQEACERILLDLKVFADVYLEGNSNPFSSKYYRGQYFFGLNEEFDNVSESKINDLIFLKGEVSYGNNGKRVECGKFWKGK